jgi:hypothetical protein
VGRAPLEGGVVTLEAGETSADESEDDRAEDPEERTEVAADEPEDRTEVREDERGAVEDTRDSLYGV